VNVSGSVELVVDVVELVDVVVVSGIVVVVVSGIDEEEVGSVVELVVVEEVVVLSSVVDVDSSVVGVSHGPGYVTDPVAVSVPRE
jgi:hypothetical protein